MLAISYQNLLRGSYEETAPMEFRLLHRIILREDYFETAESQADGADDYQMITKVLLQRRNTTLSYTD